MMRRADGPPSTFEERLKEFAVPPKLYIRYRALKELARGESEIRLLPFMVDRQRNAVDAGANKGVYAHFMARLARQVWAFEPNPKMYRTLRRTAAANVLARALALSDVSGKAVLRIPQRGNARGYSNQGGTLRTALAANFLPVEVEAVRLDELALADVGFIKIDVEGFEQQVLEGARETIARDRPALLVEIEEKHTGQPIEHSLARVLALGYRGMFLDRAAKVLRPLEWFDPERHHRSPGAAAPTAYVFNFAFFPLR